MLKTSVLLLCLSVTLGVGYSASNGTATATPTASNTTATAKPTTTGNTTAKPTTTGNTTAKPTTTGNTTAKPTTTGNTTAKPTTTGNTTAKPTTTGNTTAKPTTGSTTVKPTTGSTTAKPTTGSTTAKSTTGSTTAKSTTGSTTKKTTTASTTKKTTTASTTKKATTHTSKPTNGSTTPTRNGTVSTPTSTTKKTTARSPTTTPLPYGTFSLKAGPNATEYCLLAEFAVTFTINYMAYDFKEKNRTIYLNRTNNKNVKIDGDCGSNNTDAKLILTWPKKNHLYNLTMVFNETAKGLEAKSNDTWSVKKITFNVILEDNPDFKNATEKNFTSTFSGSSTPTYGIGGYYSCKSKDAVKFETTTKNYTVQSVFEDVKLEPFVKKTASDAFGNDTYQCYQDNPTKAPISPTSPTGPSGNKDIVPIAVGCALAGLVLIVLIAYIIGRRKSHRGYEKV